MAGLVQDKPGRTLSSSGLRAIAHKAEDDRGSWSGGRSSGVGAAYAIAAGSDRPQIQFWKIIRRPNVAIDVPMNAADIGSITMKPAKPIATKAHNNQTGALPRLKA